MSMPRRTLSLAFAASGLALGFASADEHAHQQEMGYFVPGQHNALGEAVAGSEPAAVEFNRATADQTAAYDRFFTENRQRHLQEVIDLVAFPTIRADPSHKDDMDSAAAWLKNKLETIGMQNVTVHLPDYPFITSEWMGAPGQPTVIFYGHLRWCCTGLGHGRHKTDRFDVQ